MTIPESDWKFLNKMKPELLNSCCLRVNNAANSIIKEETLSEHDKYLQLFKHIQVSDKIVSNCFDDWRRSNIFTKIYSLCDHKLLTKEIIDNLTPETQQRLHQIKEFTNE